MSESKISAETLTDEERAELGEIFEGERALRIIDQLTAALEAAQDPDEWRVECQYFTTLFYSEKSRAEALQAEVTRLTAALEAAERALEHELRNGPTHAEWLKTHNRAEALQARVAELEASVAAYDSAESRMSGELADALEASRAAEAELADLRGRVARAIRECDPEHPGAVIHAARVLEVLRG